MSSIEHFHVEDLTGNALSAVVRAEADVQIARATHMIPARHGTWQILISTVGAVGLGSMALYRLDGWPLATVLGTIVFALNLSEVVKRMRKQPPRPLAGASIPPNKAVHH